MKKLLKVLVVVGVAICVAISPLMETRVFALTARQANIPESGTMTIAQLQQEKRSILPQKIQEDLISLPFGQLI